MALQRAILSLGGVVLMLAPTVAMAQEAEPRAAEGRTPEFRPSEVLQRPSASEIGALFPSGAVREGVSGQATVSCVIAASDRLEACTASGETPSGYGFAEAALRSAAYFRVRPASVNGEPLRDGRFTYPVRFNMAAPGKAAAVTRAQVLEQPTGAAIRDLYPAAARAKAMGGKATVTCEITSASTLANCVVVAEDPPGYGFGDAVKKAAALYRVRPPTIEGRLAPGAKFTIPMRFEMELPSIAQQEADAKAARPPKDLRPHVRAPVALWAPGLFAVAVLAGLAAVYRKPRPPRRKTRAAGQFA